MLSFGGFPGRGVPSFGDLCVFDLDTDMEGLPSSGRQRGTDFEGRYVYQIASAYSAGCCSCSTGGIGLVPLAAVEPDDFL